MTQSKLQQNIATFEAEEACYNQFSIEQLQEMLVSADIPTQKRILLVIWNLS